MRRYTIVYHNYFHGGFYLVEFKRILCKPEELPDRMKSSRYGNPHFSIAGWPELLNCDGSVYFTGPGKRTRSDQNS